MRVWIFILTILAFCSLGYAIAAPIQGLVLYMPFDEGDGDETEDVSDNNNNGTFVGKPKWVDGKIGKALEFSGEENKNYVEIPDGPSINPQEEITCAAWIYYDTFIGSGGIISKYIGAGNQRSYTIHMHHDSVNALASDISSDGAYSAGVTAVSVGTEAETLKEGEWQHIAMTFKAGEFVRLYINGEMLGEEDAAPVDNLFDNDVPLIIGNDFQIGGQHRAGQPREFTGMIDEVVIFNRVLSDDEIISVMNGDIMPVNPQGHLAVTWGDIKK
jgi:hypothetical protein